MRCPFCKSVDDKVVDSRSTMDGYAIRRRRECLQCGKRFTTYEKIDGGALMVIKRDNTRDAFDRDKLRSGIVKACQKRPVSIEQIDNLVDRIERTLQGRWDKEVSSTEIGEMVMEGLRELDHVAFVRFASVYRQFRDVGDFVDEVKKLTE